MKISAFRQFNGAHIVLRIVKVSLGGKGMNCPNFWPHLLHSHNGTHVFLGTRHTCTVYFSYICSWKHTELVSMGYVLRTTQKWHNILIQRLSLINAVKYWALVTFRLVSHKVKWANSRVSKWRTQADRHLGFRYFIIHD